MGAQTDTRSRIQEVALQLFTENGYEATSLREIAEALNVTKAALYYHFKTKDDIVASLTEDRVKSLDALVAWAKEQPHTAETRRELIRRYSHDMTHGRDHQVMRFLERNQTALQGHGKVGMMRERMTALLGVLCGSDDPIDVKLRRAMAIFSMHAVWFVLRDEKATDEERTEAALEVALELIDSAEGCTAREGR
ncbi:TetR/AcrR family transcriptional regulator [Microtetraspora sp. NBRC 16547]|uniref:TetR/AcrR family transcriptional regulator n=1 Tax=Microtetraspora sp. NBRC 16547 TaxID=3030993 RepID=UPI0024A0220A|nr:TetR/AcrR family transcriptional regulator [Microtetraspora sp. NBRC 16547]GLX01625.1 TetR family transcriptional regulator [Microtetraspora sp. NBRC 16547]